MKRNRQTLKPLCRLFFVASITLALPSTGHSYQCKGYGYKKDLQNSQRVFIGKVTHAQNEKATFDVIENFKGENPKVIEVQIAKDLSMVQPLPIFTVGKSYLIATKPPNKDSDQTIKKDSLDLHICDIFLDSEKTGTKKRIEFLRSPGFKE